MGYATLSTLLEAIICITQQFYQPDNLLYSVDDNIFILMTFLKVSKVFPNVTDVS